MRRSLNSSASGLITLSKRAVLSETGKNETICNSFSKLQGFQGRLKSPTVSKHAHYKKKRILWSFTLSWSRLHTPFHTEAG